MSTIDKIRREREHHETGHHPRRRGAPPAEAMADRSAQEHDRADQDVSLESASKQPVYPAGRLRDEQGDNTPSALDPRVEWDDVVQPPHGVRADEDLPLPEGK